MIGKSTSGTEAPGQDSFLDIVANLVGILIILVMVVGVGAQDAMLDTVPADGPPQPDLKQISTELVAVKDATLAVEADIHRLDSEMKRQQLDMDYRRQERDQALLMVTAAEKMIADRRSQLDQEQRAHFDSERELIAARSRLVDLEQGIESARTEADQVSVIEHLPTPMAKTVFGKELHFRLKQGKLTYIPWAEIIARLEHDAPEQLWRLREHSEVTETLGPFGGFWIKYTLRRVERTVTTQAGVSARQGAELDHFVLVPASPNLGEPFAEVLRQNSDFRARLAGNSPESTTVTIWTYPDSFEEFRALKKELFRLGYLTACRLLPEDQPIGGSPRGSRSSSQ